jgi:membrane protein required for colicin V production
MVRCSLKGFISEVMSMAALVFGLLAALLFYKKGGALVRENFLPGVKVIPEILAFIALFLIIFIVIKILEKILKDIIEGIHLGGTDRFLGILFGLIEGFVVVSLVLLILDKQPLFDASKLLESSLFAQILLPIISAGIQDAESAVQNAAWIIPGNFKIV